MFIGKSIFFREKCAKINSARTMIIIHC